MIDGVPGPIGRLIEELSKLPTIGPKTASRLAFFLLKSPKDQVAGLAGALQALNEGVVQCGKCFNYADRDPCAYCADDQRDGKIICVVEDALDLLAIERSGGYRGRYHVLEGAISPLEGIGPDDLRLTELVTRVKDEGITEVVVATNATFEGDATALEVARLLDGSGVRVTRLARGLATGGDLEYVDAATIAQALEGRREF